MSEYVAIDECGTASSSLISISGLDNEVEKRVKALNPAYTDEEREIVKQWMAMLTVGYISEKIIDARLRNQSCCTLVKSIVPVESVKRTRAPHSSFYLSNLFHERMDPYQLSIKDHIESLVDIKEMRIFFFANEHRVKIVLDWNPFAQSLSKFIREHPGPSALGVCAVFIMLVMFINIIFF